MFALRHARREARSSARRLGVYMMAITLGVAALVAINSLRANIVRSVQEESRALLGADVRLSSSRAFPDSVLLLLDSLRADGAGVAVATTTLSMAYAPASGAVRMVQLRAIERGFPFYGRVATEPAGAWPPAGDAALLDPALFNYLDVAIGDSVAIGEAVFIVAGSAVEASAEGGFQEAIGPRLFIAVERMADTGLLGFGSLVRHQAYLRLADDRAIDRLVDGRRGFLRRHAIGVQTAEEQAENLAQALDNLGRFLALVGLAALLLGGIGVGSAVNVFVREKRATIAVLRCLGATQWTAFSAYLLQAAGLGLAGAALGVVLGVIAQAMLPALLSGLLPVEVQAGVDLLSVVAGLVIGTAVALLFALLPLLEIRSVTPLQALRHVVEPPRRRFGPARLAAWALLAGGIAALGVWQAGEWRAGLAFAGGLALTLLVLAACAAVLVRLARRLFPRRAGFAVRQGMANLWRPANQTSAVLLALGFGVFLIASLWLVQRNLIGWIDVDLSEERPNLLVIDIQEAQTEGVAGVLAAAGVDDAALVPIVPARIAALHGEPVDSILGAARARGIEPWTLRREYRHTYRDRLTGGEAIVAGEWWDAAPPAPTGVGRISLEQDLARGLRVDIGDRITWNFQGIEIETQVASLRSVDWARFETNFFVVFEPGVIDRAPRSYVTLVHTRDDAQRASVQRDLVRAHPNLSIVDLTVIQETLRRIVGRAALAIRTMALFSVAAGALVLAGAIAASRFQRVREAVLLRAIGATRPQIRRILLTEYLALGTLAALTGAILATVAAWILVERFFRIEFRPFLLDTAILVVVVAAAAAVIGMANSREAVRSTPLAALREAD
jgi:putative ABC transport system permease protein